MCVCNIEVYICVYVCTCMYIWSWYWFSLKKEEGMLWGLGRRCWIWEAFRGMMKICWVKFSKNQWNIIFLNYFMFCAYAHLWVLHIILHVQRPGEGMLSLRAGITGISGTPSLCGQGDWISAPHMCAANTANC